MSILIYFATIFWSLFPNLIHVFQGGDDFVNKVNETNLVVNSDLSLDNNDDGVPDGFVYSANTTDKTLVDGIVKFTSTSQYALFQFRLDNLNSQTIYTFARFKTDGDVRLSNLQTLKVTHSGSGDYEFLSLVETFTSDVRYAQITDYRVSDFTPIEVDYIGAYNVSTMIFNGVKSDDGVLFSDLTEQEIKQQLDIWITEHGSFDFAITSDKTADKWFNTGFVQKTAERDFLDYLGYFFWLMTPPIILFATLDLIRRVI